MENLKLNPRLAAIGAILGFVAGAVLLNNTLLGIVFALLVGGVLGSGMATKR